MAGNTYPATGGKPNFIQFVTPVGMISRLHHDEPRLKTDFNTKQPVRDDKGVQVAEYMASIVWPKAYMDIDQDPNIPGGCGLIPMRRQAYQAQCEAWPATLDPAQAAWVRLQPFLLDGDNPEHNTERKEFLFGKVWLNVKQRAKYRQDPQTGKVTYEGAPGILGAYGEDISAMDIWAGCEGRLSGILYGTEFAGKKFISVRLNNIQKFRDGERMGGGSRPDAKSQFDPLMQGQPPMAAMPGLGGGFGAPPPQGQFGSPPTQNGTFQQGGFPPQGQPQQGFGQPGYGQPPQQFGQPQGGYPPQQGNGFPGFRSV